jgi:hypothetical protein
MTVFKNKVLKNLILHATRVGALVCLVTSAGCAIHYYDKASGTEHLWGFGHMKMKVIPPNEGVQAVVKGTEMLGFNLATGQEDYHLGLGWDYRRRIEISSNAAVPAAIFSMSVSGRFRHSRQIHH